MPIESSLANGSNKSFTSRFTTLGTAAIDNVPPTISAVAIGLADGFSTGFVRSSGSYRAFAVTSDDVALASINADISLIGTGTISLSDVGGPWWMNGTTYTHRSDPFTAQSGLTLTKIFSITSVDTSNNTTSLSGTVTIDNNGPSGSDIQTTPGVTSGRAESGDTVIFTYTEAIETNSLLAAWTGQSSATVKVRITDGGTGNDILTVWDSLNTTQVNLGSVDLGRNDYVTGNVIFGGASPSTMSISSNVITVTLGTPDIAARVIAGTGAAFMVWTPSTLATDRAGNPCSATSITEGGARDREF